MQHLHVLKRFISRAKGQSAKIERDAATKATEFETRARRNVENDVRKEKQKVQTLENSLKQKEQRLDGDYKRKEDVLNTKIKSLDDRNEKLRIQEARLLDIEKQSTQAIQELKAKNIKADVKFFEEIDPEKLSSKQRDDCEYKVAELRKSAKDLYELARRIRTGDPLEEEEK